MEPTCNAPNQSHHILSNMAASCPQAKQRKEETEILNILGNTKYTEEGPFIPSSPFVETCFCGQTSH